MRWNKVYNPYWKQRKRSTKKKADSPKLLNEAKSEPSIVNTVTEKAPEKTSVKEEKAKKQKLSHDTAPTRSHTIETDKLASKPKPDTLSTPKVYEDKPVTKIAETVLNRENTSVEVQSAPPETVLRKTEQILEIERTHVVFDQSAKVAISTQTLGKKLPVRTPNTSEARKEITPEIKVVTERNKIIIGIQPMQTEGHKENTESVELIPIITAGELGKTLDYIDNFILKETVDQTAPELVILVSQEMLELIDVIVDEEVKSQQLITFSSDDEGKKGISIDGKQLLSIRLLLHALDAIGEQNQVSLAQIDSLMKEIEAHTEGETSALTLTVSDALLTFIETGGKILGEIKREIESEKNVFITVHSADRKITIDATTLKKLMRVLKKKQQIDRRTNIPEDMQAPEEVQNSLPVQNGSTISIWSFYQALLYILLNLINQPATSIRSDRFHIFTVNSRSYNSDSAPSTGSTGVELSPEDWFATEVFPDNILYTRDKNSS